MKTASKKTFLLFSTFLFFSPLLFSQNLKLKGFFDFDASYKDNKSSFTLGEEDLFITSELSDRISFLGETVFKFDPSQSTLFYLNLERAVIKYNFAGNNNLLFGKHHTPINYWNDTYHHGRVFFPTIFRPALFKEIVPLHTTGVSIQGHDMGNLRFGYDLMIGNGMGSNDVLDNDKFKSFTAAIHVKPVDGMRIGASAYYDNISAGAHSHSGIKNTQQVREVLLSGSFGYFGNKLEFLAEGTYGTNHTDSIGDAASTAYYVYAGYNIFRKVHIYGRFDQLLFNDKEMLFSKNDLKSIVGGLRFEINYITVVKVEFQYDDSELGGKVNTITAQFAIGF